MLLLICDQCGSHICHLKPLLAYNDTVHVVGKFAQQLASAQFVSIVLAGLVVDKTRQKSRLLSSLFRIIFSECFKIRPAAISRHSSSLLHFMPALP